MPANSLRRISLFGINLNLESVMCALKIINKWMIKQIIELSMSWNNSKIVFEVIKNHIGKEIKWDLESLKKLSWYLVLKQSVTLT